jgi:hypothetical protein
MTRFVLDMDKGEMDSSPVKEIYNNLLCLTIRYVSFRVIGAAAGLSRTYIQ